MLIRVRGTPINEIETYCQAHGIAATKHNPVVYLGVYMGSPKVEYDWMVEDEIERTMFILKWGKND